MSVTRIKGNPNNYDVKDRDCIGRPHLNLHPVSIRGATTSGSRLVGYQHCCSRRNYYSCPNPVPAFEKALTQEPKAARLQKRSVACE